MELNHALQEVSIDALESDMGEYIVQLADEKPSHIIMPAIHKTKEDVAHIFAEQIPGAGYTEDVDELIAIGRRALRDPQAATKLARWLEAQAATWVAQELAA